MKSPDYRFFCVSPGMYSEANTSHARETWARCPDLKNNQNNQVGRYEYVRQPYSAGGYRPNLNSIKINQVRLNTP